MDEEQERGARASYTTNMRRRATYGAPRALEVGASAAGGCRPAAARRACRPASGAAVGAHRPDSVAAARCAAAAARRRGRRR